MNKQDEKRCPESHLFVDAFLDELKPGEKARLADHIFSCPECLLKFQLLKQVRDDLRKKVEESAKEHFLKGQEKGTGALHLKYLSLAAGLLFLVVAGYVLFSLYSRNVPVRGRPENTRLHLIEPEGKVKEAPEFFVWTEVKGAESYQFELSDKELRTILSLRVNQTKVSLPGDVRKTLTPGETYVWVVEAYDRQRRRLDCGYNHFEIQ